MDRQNYSCMQGCTKGQKSGGAGSNAARCRCPAAPSDLPKSGGAAAPPCSPASDMPDLWLTLARIPYSQCIPEVDMRDPRQGLEHGFQASASSKGSKLDVVRNPCCQPLLESIMVSLGSDPLHLTHPWRNTGDPKQGQQHRIQAIVTFIVFILYFLIDAICELFSKSSLYR